MVEESDVQDTPVTFTTAYEPPTTRTHSQSIEQTPIQKFYDGANVLVTGATGFLGKILVEKLLRSCPSLSAVYVLIRNKKGKDMHNRIDELFDDIIFDRLREECPKFRHKVVGISGDCSLPNLGLSIQDRQTLIEKISVIFHVAATVRFDEKLKMAVAINVRSPRDMLVLSRQMKNLKSVVHVSTAYSNCPFKVVEEKIYPAPIDSNKLIEMAESVSEKIMDSITPSMLGKWPNTYAFTKQVAEDAVKENGYGLPVGIFRPAIVVSTYKEPVPSWINNLYGPTGVAAGAGTGVLRTLRADPNVNANLVPVDMCVNSLIATAWDIADRFEESKKNDSMYEIPVYQYESSNDQPVTWGEFMDYSTKYGLVVPSVKAVWYFTLTLQPNLFFYYLTMFFMHTIPALIVDAALVCVGKSPKMMKIYKKIHKFTAVISYFAIRNWEFKSYNVRRLLDKMTKKDREIFFSDLKELDWKEFFTKYLIGIRIYLIQDPISTLPEALAKWNRLYWLHQILKLVIASVLVRILWSVVTYTYSTVL